MAWILEIVATILFKKLYCQVYFDNVYHVYSYLIHQQLFLLCSAKVVMISFQMTFITDVKCKSVCQKTYKNNDKDSMPRLKFLKKGISLNYNHHW
jgi:hypothetical protein